MIQTFFGGSATQFQGGVHIFYMPLNCNLLNSVRDDEEKNRNIITVGGTFKNLRVLVEDATRDPGAGETFTITLFKNGSPTSLQAVISGAAVSASDTSNEVEVVAGDVVSLKIEKSVGAEAFARFRVTTQLLMNSNHDSNITGRSQASVVEGSTYYGIFTYSATTIEGRVVNVIPTDGKIRNLRLDSEGAPGAGKSWTFTLVKNGTPTALSATISDAETTAEDLVNEVEVADGDEVYLKLDTVGEPAVGHWITHGMIFRSKEPKQYITGGTTSANVNNSADYSTFFNASLGTTAVSGNPFIRNQIGQAGVTIKKMVIRHSVAPGAGKSYDYILYENEAPTGLALILEDAETVKEVSSDVAVADLDRYRIVREPTGTPAVARPSQNFLLEDTTTFISEIKELVGVVYASLKKVSGVAIASAKQIMGLN